MPIEHKPKYPKPRDAVPKDSIRHEVQNGESWKSLAERYGVTAAEIIYANFWTLIPEEINWYLRRYVHCVKATPDGKNWMFSKTNPPGVIYIPPKKVSFDPEEVVGTPPPKYFTVRENPLTWTPPEMVDGGKSAKEVVTLAPWQHEDFSIGSVNVKSRKSWGAEKPKWKNEVIYYNVKAYPLIGTLDQIVVHHTDNSSSVSSNESKQKGKGYAALGYHFFIDDDGTVLEGRPLEIMGSHAGTGATSSGPLNDPDWGAIGIVLKGDYQHGDDRFWSSNAPKKQLQALEDLVNGLRAKFSIRKLLMHREVTRGGTPTVCPGDHMVPKVIALRTKLGMQGP
jgi:N-acetylmuramoyl-L-alanine amidase